MVLIAEFYCILAKQPYCIKKKKKKKMYRLYRKKTIYFICVYVDNLLFNYTVNVLKFQTLKYFILYFFGLNFAFYVVLS